MGLGVMGEEVVVQGVVGRGLVDVSRCHSMDVLPNLLENERPVGSHFGQSIASTQTYC